MNILTFDQALQTLLNLARKVKGEDTITLEQAEQANGRILATPQQSTINVPPADNSSMDGYAVRCNDIPAIGTHLPISQRITAGSTGTPLTPGTAARIFTGAPIPQGADAIIIQENCTQTENNHINIQHIPKPGDWIRTAGEDIRANQQILPAGTILTPQAIGLIASTGTAQIKVNRRLTVALLSSGDELTPPGQPLPPGAIYNSNHPMLRSHLQQLGCTIEDLGHIPDTLEHTRKALRKGAALADLVLTTGGVSVGEEDHIRKAVELDGEINLWRIAIKPGKPLAYGKIATADFIGLPGNPVSAWITFLLLVKPFIRTCQGATTTPPAALTLPANFQWQAPKQRREFLRARINNNGQLEIYPNQSSGVLTSAQWASGLADIPAGQTIKPGDLVRYLPLTELEK